MGFLRLGRVLEDGRGDEAGFDYGDSDIEWQQLGGQGFRECLDGEFRSGIERVVWRRKPSIDRRHIYDCAVFALAHARNELLGQSHGTEEFRLE